jgi:hypothetical protein
MINRQRNRRIYGSFRLKEKDIIILKNSAKNMNED